MLHTNTNATSEVEEAPYLPECVGLDQVWLLWACCFTPCTLYYSYALVFSPGTWADGMRTVRTDARAMFVCIQHGRGWFQTLLEVVSTAALTQLYVPRAGARGCSAGRPAGVDPGGR